MIDIPKEKRVSKPVEMQSTRLINVIIIPINDIFLPCFLVLTQSRNAYIFTAAAASKFTNEAIEVSERHTPTRANTLNPYCVFFIFKAITPLSFSIFYQILRLLSRLAFHSKLPLHTFALCAIIIIRLFAQFAYLKN